MSLENTRQETITAPDIRDVDFVLPGLGGVVEPQIRDAMFSGVPVVVEMDQLGEGINLSTGIGIRIKILSLKKENLAQIKISIKSHRPSQKYIMLTNVTRYDPIALEALKGKGLGRALWEVSLKLAQKFAGKLDSPVIHEVMREPSPSLSDDKWLELFSPLLEKYGYSRINVNLWRKTYLPHK